MQLTFNSRSLSKTLSFDDIASLEHSSLRQLYAELTIAIMSMDDHIQETEEAPTQPEDPTWLKRVKRKRRICQAFEAQVKQRLDLLSVTPSSLDVSYLRHLERLCSEELGAVVFGDIRTEARSLAAQELQERTIDALRS